MFELQSTVVEQRTCVPELVLPSNTFCAYDARGLSWKMVISLSEHSQKTAKNPTLSPLRSADVVGSL